MHAPVIFCILSILLAATSFAFRFAQSEISHVNVFSSGQDGYYSYRIPAIATAPDGSLLAFAEARRYNGADPGMEENDIDLVMKRSKDGGQTWSSMKVIEDPGERWSAANPAPVVDRTNGNTWLFYIRSKPGRSSETARAGTRDMQNLARLSDDNGVTWSEPIDLTAVARDMSDPHWRISVVGPGGSIQDDKGRLIAPVWRRDPPGVFAILSMDQGRTWQRSQVVPGGRGGNENQLVELSDGRILMDFRQDSGLHRWMAVSNDGGETWSEPREGATVSPVACAVERYTLRPTSSGRDRILWTGPKGPGRRNLVIRVSYNEGQTFPAEHPVSEGYAAYSDLTILKDKSVGILWERGVQQGYQFITFTRISQTFVEPAK
jgi:sialidase-1